MYSTLNDSKDSNLDSSMVADIMNMKDVLLRDFPYPERSSNVSEFHRTLLGCAFGQKWTDLICGQMEPQITVLVSKIVFLLLYHY